MTRNRNSDNSGAARAQHVRWMSAAAGPSARSTIGSMALNGVLWNKGVWPQTQGSELGAGEGSGSPAVLPQPPTDIIAVGGNAEATVSFTPPVDDGGSPIIMYIVRATPSGNLEYGTSSPIVVPYLLNNTSYTFTVVAKNSVGTSIPSSVSNSITTLTPPPSAPRIRSITNIVLTSIFVSITAPLSFGTITNYEYSLDGGNSFTALSPVDNTSPINIPATTGTTYSIAIRAVNNLSERGEPSNIVTYTTPTTQITETFSTPGSTTWTAPANVIGVEVLCVAGGGGGGAAYSKINVLGTVPVQSTPASGYWIYNGSTTSNYTNGRMYNGSAVNPNYTTFVDPIRCTTTADLQPTGTSAASQKWYSMEIVYDLTSALPIVTNVGYPSSIVSSLYNNNSSGGGGGGAHGELRTLTSPSRLGVYPFQSYTVIVGDGGEGGVGGPNSETEGAKGGDSRFSSVVCQGGSGGRASRDLNINLSTTPATQDYIQNGYHNGGSGLTTTTSLIGGYGGQGWGGNTGGNAITGGNGGASTLVGPVFPGSYAPGGPGGTPNIVATGVTTPNIGAGGAGTGATTNSYASGIKGGTGVVIIKYYI